MNASTPPLANLIPETAPFSPEQRAWLKGRDDCPYSREADGADFVLLVADCVYSRTRDRADEMERYRGR